MLSSVVFVCIPTPVIHTSLIPIIWPLGCFLQLRRRKKSAQFHSLLSHLPHTPFLPISNPHNFLLPPPGCQHDLLCHLLIPSGEGYEECGISAKAALQGPLQQSLSEQLTQHKQGWLRCAVWKVNPCTYLCHNVNVFIYIGLTRLLYFHRNCLKTGLDRCLVVKQSVNKGLTVQITIAAVIHKGQNNSTYYFTSCVF